MFELFNNSFLLTKHCGMAMHHNIFFSRPTSLQKQADFTVKGALHHCMTPSNNHNLLI